MGEVQKTDLINMFDRAAEDLAKATKLLQSEPSKKDAATRFIKLSRRFYDVYKLFTDTFYLSLNVIAAKALLCFARACFIVSNTLMSTDWFEIPLNTGTKKRLVTLPKRAVHKIYKRTIKPSFYLYNHDDEDYERLGFKKYDINAPKRQYEQELRTIAAGLKQIGFRLMLLFNSTRLLDEKYRKEGPSGDVPGLEDLNLVVAMNDLITAKDIVFGYYKAITVQNSREESDDEEVPTIADILAPLMEQFGMTLRSTVVSTVKEKEKSKGYFSELTDSKGDLIEVTKLIMMLDQFSG